MSNQEMVAEQTSHWRQVLVAAATAGALLLGACSSGPEAAEPLSASADIMPGVFVEGGMTQLRDYANRVGHKPSIIAYYTAWGGNDSDFRTSKMNDIRDYGAYPLVTWEPWKPGQGAGQPEYQLADIYTGKYDEFITKWAKDAKAWGHPFFLRLMQEMNGNWYPWDEQVNGNHPGDFVKAWAHVRNIFRQVGADNVSWVWCVNSEYPGSENIATLKPADSDYDWAALDAYNSGNPWRSFADAAGPTYRDLQKIVPAGRPYMMAETGSPEDPADANAKAVWIRGMLGAVAGGELQGIDAIVWFDQDKSGRNNRDDSSPTTETAFRQMMGSNHFSANNFGKAATGPIPALAA